MATRLLARSILTCSLAGLAGAQCEVVKLMPGDSTPYAQIGWDVVFDDGTLAIAGDSSTLERMVYFFEASGGDWSVSDQILLPSATKAYPLALERDMLLVGVKDHQGGQGQVLSYERGSSGWTLVQYISAGAPLPDAHFGRRIDLDGDRMVIAAPMYESQEYRGGAVFLFDRVGNQWVETQRIEPQVANYMGFFGLAVALEGELLAVGEPGYVFGVRQDLVHIYRDNGGQWVLEEMIQGPAKSLFGYSLDWNQGRLVIGASEDHTHGGPWEGAVHLYEWSGTWQHTDQLHSSHPFGDDGFGMTVAWEGDLLTVGSAALELGGGERVHLYQRTAGAWDLVELLAPHGDDFHWGSGFGAAFAFDAGRLWVTSPGDYQDELGYQAGAVYGYTFERQAEFYCGPANLNSTGVAAELRGAGCATLAQNDLALEASRLPPDQPCLFLVSRNEDFIPLPPGSQGNLCLGGAIGRFEGVGSSGPGGFLMRFVDLDALPLPTGPYSAQPGETWNFQCWFRDLNPGPTSNFTDAVSVLVR